MIPLIIKLLQWEFVVTTIVIFFSVEIKNGPTKIADQKLNLNINLG